MKTIETLKILRLCLLTMAGMFAITAVFCFIKGKTEDGICNIIWTGSVVLFYLTAKESERHVEFTAKVVGFFSDIADITESGKRAVIEDKDGQWQLSALDSQDSPEA